jgi:ATP/maltotriose-dependent transcriptional regulator MalT
MSIWRWVRDFRRDAAVRGDEERLRLAGMLDEAYPHFETDPDRALAILLEGRRLAEMLAEPRWVLFYEHWRLQVLLFHKGDYRDAVGLAVKATVESAKPQHGDFPQRVCLQEDLINAYAGIDPVGYEEAIEQALQYMQREVTRDMECRHCVESCRFRFEADRGDLEAARAAALRGLTLAEEDASSFYLASSFWNLCIVAHRSGDFTSLREWAEAGEEAARQVDRKAHVAQFLLWQAVAARHDKDEDRARRLCRRAIARVSHLEQPPSEDYHDALSAYHELGGKLAKALKVCERELEMTAGQGELARTCRAQIKRCSLLARMGLLTEADREAAREAARRLRKPDSYLAEIERLA